MSGYRYQGSTRNDPLRATCGDRRGTPTGYNRHRVAGENPCDECRRARNAYQSRWRAGKPRGHRAVVNQRVRQRALNALRRMHPADFERLLYQEHAREATP